MDRETAAILEGINKTLAILAGNQIQQKAISGAPNAQLVFGPKGFFSNFGLEDTVINASISPRGMSGMIPAIPTVYLNPIYPFLTGFEGDGSAEPDGPCDDAPGGVLEVCHQTAAFGRVARSSKEMEVNTLMQVLNNKLTTDLRLLGDVIGEGHQLLTQEGVPKGGWLNSVVQSQLVIIGIEFQRWLTRMLFQGNPVNNTNGGYAEFPGLEILVSTGKVDAFSNSPCPALDSDIKDFGFNPIDGASPSIVSYLSMMMQYLTHNAERMSLDPVDWVIAMRPQLFFELSAVWPCQYLTDRCANSAGTNVVVMNDATNVNMRDEMRRGKYLWINGLQVPVVTDDGIFEDNNATNANLIPGQFASDIYILPLRAKGMRTLYWEFLDYSQAQGDLAVLRNKGQFWVTDGGRYMWSMQNLNYCFKFQGKIEPRVVLRTPQLAGRLENIMYEPLQHLREPFQSSPYFAKGGDEYYPTPPSFYNEWN